MIDCFDFYMEVELDRCRSSVSGRCRGPEFGFRALLATPPVAANLSSPALRHGLLECQRWSPSSSGRRPGDVTLSSSSSINSDSLLGAADSGLCSSSGGGQRRLADSVRLRPPHRPGPTGAAVLDVRQRFHASRTSVRWNLVMGTRYVCSRKAVAPYPWSLQALLGLVLVICTLIGPTEQSCRVEQCYQDMVSADVPKNSTEAYCAALRKLYACLRETARSCRGDLKFHSVSTLVLKWLKQNNCTVIEIRNASSITPLTMTPTKPPRGGGGGTGGGGSGSSSSHQCAFHGKHEYQYCALFGDPHLHTFNNERQTCRILRAWPLIDNAYLAVQVTNDAVLPGDSTATATTKVTVIIKGAGTNCAHHKTYEAQVGNLPSAFVDGTHGNGPERYARIREKEPNHHVEIFVRYIATTIVIRQVGDYLTVAIRMPKEVVHQGLATQDDGLQLCMKGCPSKERIDFVGFLRSSSSGVAAGGNNAGFSRDKAVAACLVHDLTDFHFQACVFDLMTTGDYTFGQAASKAAHDQKTLDPGWKENSAWTNRTGVWPNPEQQDPTVPAAPNGASRLLVCPRTGDVTTTLVLSLCWIVLAVTSRALLLL